MAPGAKNAEVASRTGFTGVKVWDIAVRLFHWSLVLLVATAAITGFLAAEWWLDFHVIAGIGIGVLLLFRIIWGFVGSHYARFSSFFFAPREVVDHLRQTLKGKAGHYPGHNPAGALMIFALIGVLAGLTVSGFIVLGGQENRGALAAFIDYQGGRSARNIHEILAFLLLAMIGAHLAGVVLESILGRENLVRAMITGYKRAKAATAVQNAGRRALLVLALIALIGGPGYWFMAGFPASGFIQMKTNAAWASECGDCHIAYHPSLLPRSSWRKIMAGLDEHFGEDASIDEAAKAEITAFLSNYASEEWDSEAASEFRKTDAQKPLEITATPYWKQRHGDMAAEIFNRKAIGSKGNCLACHKDAASGRFADEEISIPE